VSKGEAYNRALQYARAALESMGQHGIPVTPPNFTVWYSHATGQYDELSRELDQLIADAVPFTEDRNKEIHDRYFGPTIEGQSMQQIATQLQAAVAQIIKALVEAADDRGRYTGKLQDAARLLERGESVGALRTVVDSLLHETRRMDARNQSLEAALEQSTDQIAQLNETLDEVRREAMTDALTGIANRKRFDQVLKAAMDEARDNNLPLSLLMVDIDHFKAFNDKYGHRLGDQVLKLVARALQDTLKGRDLPSRYGGEEFAVILPETGLRNAVKVGNLIREGVSSKRIHRRTSHEVLGSITLSVGVASLREEDTPGSLIDRADNALYTAKRSGRNCVIDETRLAEPAEVEEAAVGRR
jgi:diguanylate cyclase